MRSVTRSHTLSQRKGAQSGSTSSSRRRRESCLRRSDLRCRSGPQTVLAAEAIDFAPAWSHAKRFSSSIFVACMHARCVCVYLEVRKHVWIVIVHIKNVYAMYAYNVCMLFCTYAACTAAEKSVNCCGQRTKVEQRIYTCNVM